MITLDEIFKHEFSFTQEQVIAFAEVTGDINPIHLDAVYAATTMFKRPIMHGMLGACLFSKVFGTFYPGEGTIYLSQTLAFKRPMYIDTKYEVVFSVKEIIAEKNRATVSTSIVDLESNTIVVTGEAIIMNVNQIK